MCCVRLGFHRQSNKSRFDADFYTAVVVVPLSIHSIMGSSRLTD